jgi:hypothetical protein
MDQLKMPLPFPGLQIDTNQSFAEQIGSRPMTAVKITGRLFNRQLKPAKLLI